MRTYDSLMFKIRFIGHDDHRKLVAILDPKNLGVKLSKFIEAVAITNGEDKKKPFARSHVLFSHGTELFLTRCVQYCTIEGEKFYTIKKSSIENR